MRFFRNFKNTCTTFGIVAVFAFLFVSPYRRLNDVELAISAVIIFAAFWYTDKRIELNEIKVGKKGITISGAKYYHLKAVSDKAEEEFFRAFTNTKNPDDFIKAFNNSANYDETVVKASYSRLSGDTMSIKLSHKNAREKILITWDMVESWELTEILQNNKNVTVVKTKIKDSEKYLYVKGKDKYFCEYAADKMNGINKEE